MSDKNHSTTRANTKSVTRDDIDGAPVDFMSTYDRATLAGETGRAILQTAYSSLSERTPLAISLQHALDQLEASAADHSRAFDGARGYVSSRSAPSAPSLKGQLWPLLNRLLHLSSLASDGADFGDAAMEQEQLSALLGAIQRDAEAVFTIVDRADGAVS